MVPNMANGNSERADQGGGSALGGERYGWSGTQSVRQSYAVENPDSLTYFALALSVDDYLWNTGISVSLQSEYTRLQGIPNDQTINNLNLPQPP